MGLKKHPGLTRKGSIILLTAIGSIFMAGLTALVTDVGWVYYSQARLQTAVNAGWKAGYDRMMELGFPLDATKKADITARVRDVMAQNGYSAAELSSIQVTFPNERTLDVSDNQTVGLFFGRVINPGTTSVGANRGDIAPDGAGMIPLAIPFGLVKDLSRTTYEVDFFDQADPTSGFASGSEYILKLGSGGGGPGATGTYDPNLKVILVPMDSGSQSDPDGFLHAYGVAYWCLKRSEGDAGYVPVDWLLGYRGGAFILPWYPEVLSKLSSEGVNYQVITGSDNVQAIYTAVGDHVLSVYNRPKIAIYSSQSSADPVEQVLQAAKIPYGTYDPARSDTYDPNLCTQLFDTEILANGLDSYNWLHLHHEDFTGFTGGCAYIAKSCQDWDSWPGGLVKTGSTTNDLCNYCRSYYFNSANPGNWGWMESWSYSNPSCSKYSTRRSCKILDQAGWVFTKTASTTTDLCNYCRNFYFYKNQNNWTSPHGSPSLTYDQANCAAYIAGSTQANRTCKYYDSSIKSYLNKYQTMCFNCYNFYTLFGTSNWLTPKTRTPYNQTLCNNWGLRCAEKADASGTRYIEKSNLATKICRQGDNERPQCRSFLGNWNTATTLGYSDAPTYSRLTKLLYNATTLVDPDGSQALAADSGIILNPGRVQRMKWDVSQKIHDHVNAGGFLFAQCFAPETLDIALWQKKVHDDQRTGPQATQNAAYSNCFAFSGFNYKAFYNAYDAPGASNGEYYSEINANNTNSFTLNDSYDARCQNHSGADPDANSGHCDSFVKNKVKGTNDGVTILGTISSTVANYVQGVVGTGEFCFMGGHSHANIQTKRLVLNNVLLGAISTKVITGGGGDGPTSGKQKSNYGPVDPDNVNGGGANDYRDRFMYGFNAPIQLSDRINTETGNKEGPTNEAVDFHVFGSGTIRVILPITDLGPEIALDTQNASATCIYDLQGQDNSGGAYSPASYTFHSSVRIIGFAEFEIIPPASYTRTDIGDYQGGQVRGRFIRYIIRPGEIPVN